MIKKTTNLSFSPSQDVLSEGHDYVNISCNSTEVGFGFFDITNLTISSVLFHMCGGHPSSESVKYVNKTSQFLYYDRSVTEEQRHWYRPIIVQKLACFINILHTFT